MKWLATLLLVLLPVNVGAQVTPYKISAWGTDPAIIRITDTLDVLICAGLSGQVFNLESPDFYRADVRRMIDSALGVWDSGAVIRWHIVNDTTAPIHMWMRFNPRPIRPDSVMVCDTTWYWEDHCVTRSSKHSGHHRRLEIDTTYVEVKP